MRVGVRVGASGHTAVTFRLGYSSEGIAHTAVGDAVQSFERGVEGKLVLSRAGGRDGVSTRLLLMLCLCLFLLLARRAFMILKEDTLSIPIVSPLSMAFQLFNTEGEELDLNASLPAQQDLCLGITVCVCVLSVWLSLPPPPPSASLSMRIHALLRRERTQTDSPTSACCGPQVTTAQAEPLKLLDAQLTSSWLPAPVQPYRLGHDSGAYEQGGGRGRGDECAR